MKTDSNKDEITLGRKAGLEILDSIKKAKKSIKIVSPYLSSSYLEELVNLSKKGIEITLITCDKLTDNRDYSKFSKFEVQDVIKQGNKIIDPEIKKSKKRGMKSSLVIFLISLFSFLVPTLLYFSISIFFLGLLIFFYYYFINQYRYTYYSTFKLKIFDSKSGINPQSTNLVHSKIFLIDDEILFLGSANFTYSAFNTHYETIVKVRDIGAIAEISKEIENIFNSTELKSKSIQELGKKIYE
jgi:phosphatidylserine/phosphatidylglycerophosphate/cardiolipin synthase-like enzyme